MPDIDAEAFGILTGNDFCDPLTAAVASTIPEPQPRPAGRIRLAWWIGAFCGLVTALLLYAAR
jgi:hypothetical protein